jgi:hypothetical protein
MKKCIIVLSVVFLMFLGANSARACHVEGFVYCDSNQNGQLDPADTPFAGVRVNLLNADGSFSTSAITDEFGYYLMILHEYVPETYRLSLDPATLPADARILVPPVNGQGEWVFWSTGYDTFQVDWLVASATCASSGLCWLTGGGVKFEPVTGLRMAERGPQHSLGGNVYPGCSPTAGDGGQWNDVDHFNKLHFQGTTVHVVACGNVSGIPPGSTSPVTPYNYIEFQGSGWLKGIKGNKANFPLVYFFARAEDRNEPGSNGAKAGALIDRYFLWVFLDPMDPIGTTLMLVDQDGNGGTNDPVLITGGNLQLHISSCDDGGNPQLPVSP